MAFGARQRWACRRGDRHALMRTVLFGSIPLDVPARVSATVVLLLVGTIAAVVPAMRVTRIDPMRAIHTE